MDIAHVSDNDLTPTWPVPITTWRGDRAFESTALSHQQRRNDRQTSAGLDFGQLSAIRGEGGVPLSPTSLTDGLERDDGEIGETIRLLVSALTTSDALADRSAIERDRSKAAMAVQAAKIEEFVSATRERALKLVRAHEAAKNEVEARLTAECDALRRTNIHLRGENEDVKETVNRLKDGILNRAGNESTLMNHGTQSMGQSANASPLRADVGAAGAGGGDSLHLFPSFSRSPPPGPHINGLRGEVGAVADRVAYLEAQSQTLKIALEAAVSDNKLLHSQLDIARVAAKEEVEILRGALEESQRALSTVATSTHRLEGTLNETVSNESDVVAKLRNALRESVAEAAGGEEEVRVLRSALTMARGALEDNIGEMDRLRRNNEMANDDNDTLRSELRALKNEIESAKVEARDKAETAMQQVLQEAAAIKDKAGKVKEEAEAKLVEAKAVAMTATVTAAETRSAQSVVDQTMERRLTDSERERVSLQRELDGTRVELSQARDSVREIRTFADKQQADIDALQRERDALRGHADDVAGAATGATAFANEIAKERDTLLLQVQELRDVLAAEVKHAEQAMSQAVQATAAAQQEREAHVTTAAMETSLRSTSQQLASALEMALQKAATPAPSPARVTTVATEETTTELRNVIKDLQTRLRASEAARGDLKRACAARFLEAEEAKRRLDGIGVSGDDGGNRGGHGARAVAGGNRGDDGVSGHEGHVMTKANDVIRRVEHAVSNIATLEALLERSVKQQQVVADLHDGQSQFSSSMVSAGVDRVTSSRTPNHTNPASVLSTGVRSPHSAGLSISLRGSPLHQPAPTYEQTDSARRMHMSMLNGSGGGGSSWRAMRQGTTSPVGIGSSGRSYHEVRTTTPQQAHLERLPMSAASVTAASAAAAAAAATAALASVSSNRRPLSSGMSFLTPIRQPGLGVSGSGGGGGGGGGGSVASNPTDVSAVLDRMSTLQKELETAKLEAATARSQATAQLSEVRSEVVEVRTDAQIELAQARMELAAARADASFAKGHATALSDALDVSEERSRDASQLQSEVMRLRIDNETLSRSAADRSRSESQLQSHVSSLQQENDTLSKSAMLRLTRLDATVDSVVDSVGTIETLHQSMGVNNSVTDKNNGAK